jgi:hypothetical protein
LSGPGAHDALTHLRRSGEASGEAESGAPPAAVTPG